MNGDTSVCLHVALVCDLPMKLQPQVTGLPIVMHHSIVRNIIIVGRKVEYGANALSPVGMLWTIWERRSIDD